MRRSRTNALRCGMWKVTTFLAALFFLTISFLPAISPAEEPATHKTEYFKSLNAPKLKTSGAKKDFLAYEGIDAVRIINKKVVNSYSDIYGSVRFMHRKHAAMIKDCTVCHHRVPRVEGDKGGVRVNMQILRQMSKKPVACDACHGKPFNTKKLARVGLKAAYHRTCVGCHKKEGKGPVGCRQCHGKNVPDHAKLVKLPGNPSLSQVNQECLRCHKKEGNDFVHSVHWKWEGFARSTLGAEKRADLGKLTYCLNNFGISIHGNTQHCVGCHPGYRWKEGKIKVNDAGRVDCLACHDTTGTYVRDLNNYGVVSRSVNLLKVASKVGKPDRSRCGLCHFDGDPSDLLHHGMMSGKLANPNKLIDVHMDSTSEETNVRCQYCHKTSHHKIAGRVVRSTPEEGVVSCERCHTATPHVSNNLLTHHLNQHTQHIACETCHIPVVFKGNEVQLSLDWSKVKNGTIKKAIMKGETVKPTYLWYNGKVKRILLGERADLGHSPIALNMPVGSFKDPQSKIAPFVIHRGKQPIDSVYQYFAIPQIWPDVIKNSNWKSALSAGMKDAGLPFSGKYNFVNTSFYSGVHHEVLPKSMALSCASCHERLNKQPSCALCHKSTKPINFVKLAHKGIDFSILVKRGFRAQRLVGSTDYINFKELGYRGDPIEVGGRFQKLELQTQKETHEKPGTTLQEND